MSRAEYSQKRKRLYTQGKPTPTIINTARGWPKGQLKGPNSATTGRRHRKGGGALRKRVAGGQQTQMTNTRGKKKPRTREKKKAASRKKSEPQQGIREEKPLVKPLRGEQKGDRRGLKGKEIK